MPRRSQVTGDGGPLTIEVQAQEADDALLARARGYANAAKFNALWTGQWTTWEEPGSHGQPYRPYPTQSEADMALMGLLAMYSGSNEQCRELFLASALGQREKAQGRHGPKYLNRMLRKVRGRQAAADAVRIANLERSKAIGDGTLEPMAAPVMTVAEMCAQLVFVRGGGSSHAVSILRVCIEATTGCAGCRSGDAMTGRLIARRLLAERNPFGGLSSIVWADQRRAASVKYGVECAEFRGEPRIGRGKAALRRT